jgi:hypothetical protein
MVYHLVTMEVMYNMLIELCITLKLVGKNRICLNETCSKDHIDKNPTTMFATQNGLKQGDTPLPLFFNFSLE